MEMLLPLLILALMGTGCAAALRQYRKGDRHMTPPGHPRSCSPQGVPHFHIDRHPRTPR